MLNPPNSWDTSYTPTERLDDAEGSHPFPPDPGRRYQPGERLANRFEIMRWIASGGMGEVYEARDKELDERVALKVLLPHIVQDTQAMQRFRREISLARQVTHPNVCRVFDFFHLPPQSSPSESPRDAVEFLTMELLRGETLSQHLAARPPLSPAQALPLIRQMCAALQAAHDVGVFHRDLKCSNVMLQDRPSGLRVVVSDFGLARRSVPEDLEAGTDDEEVTAQGEIIGSPAYMAPEQALGEPPTPAADIYSLGVVIYRMVTGHLPIEAPTAFGLLKKKLNEDPPPPKQLREDLDPVWNDAILQCLERDPAARFQASREVLRALEVFVESVPASPAKDSRRPWWVAAGTVLFGFLSIASYQQWTEVSPTNSTGPKPATAQGLAAAERSATTRFDLDPATGPSTPEHPEAARLYSAGRAQLQAFDAFGARDTFLEVIEYAPQFPLAYAALAEAHSLLGYDSKAIEQIRLAFEMSRDAPSHERLRIEGKYRELTGAWDDATQRYRVLFETYPENLEYGLDLVRSQVESGNLAEAEETLSALRHLAQSRPDDPRIDDAEFRVAWAASQSERALAAAIRAREGSERIGARLLAARSQLNEGKVLWRTGQLAEAQAATQEAHQASLELGHRSGIARALNTQATLHFFLDEFEPSLADYAAALEIFRDIGSRFGIFSVLNNKAIVLAYLGEYEESDMLREEALQVARVMGNKENTMISLANLAFSRQALGDFEAAFQLRKEALDLSRQIDNPQQLASRLIAVASSLAARDPSAARDKVEEARVLMRTEESPSDAAWALRVHAWLDMQGNDLEAARRHIDAAAAIRNAIEEETGSLETRLFLAILAQEEGRHHEVVEIVNALSQEYTRKQFRLDLARAQGLLAAAHLELGDLAAARQALEQVSKTIPVTLHDGLDIFLAAIEARILAAEGQPQDALALLDEALTQAEGNGRIDRQLEARRLMGVIEMQHGRRESGRQSLEEVARDAEALGFFRTAHKAKASLLH